MVPLRLLLGPAADPVLLEAAADPTLPETAAGARIVPLLVLFWGTEGLGPRTVPLLVLAGGAPESRMLPLRVLLNETEECPTGPRIVPLLDLLNCGSAGVGLG